MASLGDTLRGLGSALNPEVMQGMQAEDRARMAQQQTVQNMMLGQLFKGIESGAIDPKSLPPQFQGLGRFVGPSADAQQKLQEMKILQQTLGPQANQQGIPALQNPAVLESLGVALKRPEFITHAERLRKDEAQKAELKTYRSSANNPGLFSTLAQSENPYISREAKMMQDQLDRSGDTVPPSAWLTRHAALAQNEARFQETRALKAEAPTSVQFLQDANTGNKYKIQKDGTAFAAQPDGSWNEIPFAQIPASAVKLGSGGGQLGNRESVFINRIILSGNEAARDLENVVKLPLSASRGIFGGRGQTEGLFNASKETLANQLTTQEVQSYNVLATGFQRSLAAIEASGLAPNVNLSHQMDAVIFKAGDTNFTKLQKLAQTRQIVEAGLETISSNPRVPDATKKHIQEIVTKVEKAVPFTQGDLIELQKKQAIDPKITLGDIVKTKKTDVTSGEWKDL